MKANKERNETILKMRRGGMTLQEIGNIYKVSRERIRQICEATAGRGKGLSTPTKLYS